MTEKDISPEFTLKNINEINNYFIRKIYQKELLSNKNKKICTTLKCIGHFVTLVFAATICICISAFGFFVDNSKGIMTSTIGLNICAIIGRIKKYKSIIKKKKKRHDEISLLAKTNLDSIKGLISMPLTDAYIERDYFLL